MNTEDVYQQQHDTLSSTKSSIKQKRQRRSSMPLSSTIRQSQSDNSRITKPKRAPIHPSPNCIIDMTFSSTTNVDCPPTIMRPNNKISTPKSILSPFSRSLFDDFNECYPPHLSLGPPVEQGDILDDLNRILKEQRKENRRKMLRKWNFDVYEEQPINGSWKWTRLEQVEENINNEKEMIVVDS